MNPFGLNGDIVVRRSVSNLNPELGSEVRLALVAGYIVFTASLGRCYLTVVSHRPVKVSTSIVFGTLSNVFIEIHMK